MLKNNDKFTTAIENLKDSYESILEFHKKFSRKAIIFMKAHLDDFPDQKERMISAVMNPRFCIRNDYDREFLKLATSQNLVDEIYQKRIPKEDRKTFQAICSSVAGILRNARNEHKSILDKPLEKILIPILNEEHYPYSVDEILLLKAKTDKKIATFVQEQNNAIEEVYKLETFLFVDFLPDYGIYFSPLYVGKIFLNINKNYFKLRTEARRRMK